MSDDGRHHGAHGRPAFAAPRLDLPRFEFSRAQPSAPLRPSAPAAAPRTDALRPAPVVGTIGAHAPVAPAAVPVHLPVTTMPVNAMPVDVAVAPLPATQARVPAGAPTRPSYVAPVVARSALMTQSPAVASGPTALQRITPVHMGIAMVLVLACLVVTSGPGSAASSVAPARLPALVSGGGASGGVDVVAPAPGAVRAGAAQVTAATAAGARTAPAERSATAPRAVARGAAPRAAAGLRVGTATLSPTIRHGGIPSPAAAANLAVRGGGRASSTQTGSLVLGGMPSPAAAAQLGPQQLPFRPGDGVTLPRVGGERDAHAVDTHYGATDLPKAEAARPAMTPGESATRAEAAVARGVFVGSPTAGGEPLAF